MTEPTLTIEPEALPWSRTGTITVTWAGIEPGAWEVYISRDGRPEQLFGNGMTGSRTIDWVGPGSVYEFRLYAPGGVGRAAATRSIQMGQPPPRPPFVVAYPNPVAFQAGPGRATIAWDTGDGSEGTLVLVRRGARGEEEATIGSGPYGATPVDWIHPYRAYRIRLYRSDARGTSIAATTVTMGRPRRDTLIDVGIVVAASAITLLGGWLGLRLGGTLQRVLTVIRRGTSRRPPG